MMPVHQLATILPAMTLAEAIETTRIHRVAGFTGARTALVTARPCRAPSRPSRIRCWSVGTRCRCRERCRWHTMACSSWMSCPSAAAMSWRSGSRSRRVFFGYNLAGVLHLNTLADLAGRLMAMSDLGRGQQLPITTVTVPTAAV
jgi:hypothetical protein